MADFDDIEEDPLFGRRSVAMSKVVEARVEGGHLIETYDDGRVVDHGAGDITVMHPMFGPINEDVVLVFKPHPTPDCPDPKEYRITGHID